MRIKYYLLVILWASLLSSSYAQYSGGIGKGDASGFFGGKLNGPQTVSQLVITTQPPAEVLPSQVFSIAAALRDADGEVVLTATNAVTLSIASNPSLAALSGVLVTNAINGVATFSNLSINNAGIGYTLQATDGTFSATSSTFNVFTIGAGGIGKGDARDGVNDVYFSNKLFTGSASADFSLGANWTGGTFPSGEIGIVPPTAISQPVISNAQTIAAGTTINIISGASLTVAPAGVLTVNGTLNNSGTFTLQSNATGSASIGNSSGSITGNAIVQRFVPAMPSPGPLNSYGRRWRFMSSPVQNTTLQDLRQEMYVTGLGTGNVVGTLNSNGFDATFNNSPTVFRYNETPPGSSNDGWVSLNHIDSTLVPGIGYRVFVRGDRSDTNRLVRNNIIPQNAVTLDFRGVPNQGNINIPLTFTNTTSSGDGWNLVGNPYPSAIDWNLIHDPGRVLSIDSGFNGTDYAQLYHSIYIYNPVTNVYDSYNAISNTGTGGLSSGIIASGQAFFVKANAANPSLTLRESHKAISTTGLFKNSNNTSCQIQLLHENFNSNELCIKYLDESTVNEDMYDTRLLPASVNLSAWGSDGSDLTISCRPTTAVNDTIRLNVEVPVSGSYTLRFKNSNNLAIQDHITLIDNFASTATNLMMQTDYTFTVNSTIPQSFGRNRFYILISNHNPVPVELKSTSPYVVFPNPSTGQFALHTDIPGSYTLTDITGKEVQSGRCESEYTFSNMRNGVYLLKLIMDNGKVEQTKVVVTR